ncbi:MAG: hypothetical protein ACQJCO_01775 [cyanobacterium endosymbiont of Rhopalodia sterrenbergii]
MDIQFINLSTRTENILVIIPVWNGKATIIGGIPPLHSLGLKNILILANGSSNHSLILAK